MKIVLAYCGNSVPKHHLLNLRLLQRTFPQTEVVTVVDNVKSSRQLRKAGFESFLVEEELPRFEELKLKLSHNDKFLKGFWFYTIKRFFLLFEYSKTDSEAAILHIESDVILLPNFPFDAFLSKAGSIMFPLVTNTEAAASVMFIRNSTAIGNFLDFIGSCELAPNDTDMTLLLKFSRASKEVSILPSTLHALDGHPSPNSLNFNSHSVPGIFDGATYGQYLFGLDPRNNLGRRTLFAKLRNHIVNPVELKFSYQLPSLESYGQLIVEDVFSNKFTLYNLHIHSKDKRAFMMNFANPRLLIKRIAQSENGVQRSEFSPLLIFLHFPSFVRAIVHISIKFIKNVLFKKN